MLTGTQLEINAYATEYGELLCLDCAEAEIANAPTTDLHGMFLHLYDVPDPEVTGLQPVIQYGLDEWQSAEAEAMADSEDWEGHEECLPALYDANGHILNDEWHYHPES